MKKKGLRFIVKGLLIFSIALLGCTSIQKTQIGKINMIATRNIDPNLKYQTIATRIGASEKELENSTAKTIDEAIEQTVRKVPGGEFLMNVKIYEVMIREGKFYAAEGDVWGITSQISYRGFKVSDKISWKNKGNFYTGTITSLKDDKTCLILADQDSQIIELTYDEIIKYDGQKTSLQISEEKKEKENKLKDEKKIKQQQKLDQENQEKQKLVSSFKIGENVTWKRFGNFFQGEIIGVNSDNAVVSYTDSNGKKYVKDVAFEKLTKISHQSETNKTVKTDMQIYKVTSNVLNVRSGAGAYYDILIKLTKGVSVELLEKVNTEWWKIKYNEKIGYVSPKYLSK